MIDFNISPDAATTVTMNYRKAAVLSANALQTFIQNLHQLFISVPDSEKEIIRTTLLGLSEQLKQVTDLILIWDNFIQSDGKFEVTAVAVSPTVPPTFVPWNRHGPFPIYRWYAQ